MAGYLGSRPVVVQVDGYQRAEAESRYVNVSGDDFTGHLDFTDDAKARFGSSDEMHIYTESSGSGYSYIQGDSIVLRKANQSTNYLTAIGGVVSLMHSGNTKLATNSGGVTVTGNIIGSDELQLLQPNGTNNFGIELNNSHQVKYKARGSSGTHIFTNTTSDTERMRIDADGKLLIGNATSQTTDLLQVESPASGGGHGIAIRRNDNNTDQQLGRIMFGNTADSDIGQIHVKTTGATNTGAMIFSTASSGTTAERMRIQADGTTSIGRAITTTYDNDQGYPLHIQASTGNQTYIAISIPGAASGDTGLVIGHDNTGTRITNREADPIIFGISSSEKMRIDSSGNVGIGDTDPQEKFTIKGDGARMTISSADMEVAMLGRAGSSGAALDKGYLRLRNQGVTADGVVLSAGGNSWINGGNVGIGTTANALFNSVGGTTKLAVTGSSSSTDILGNTDASIAIINTDTTANNTAGLHFARADTDNNPNYAGASIVAQFLDTQATGQYPRGQLAFLTSTTANAAPSEKMRITATGNVGIGTTNPTVPLHVALTTNTAAIFTTNVTSQNADIIQVLATGSATSANIKMRTTVSGAQAQIRLGGDNSLVFANTTSDTERMRIDSSGRLLLNTTTAGGVGYSLYPQTNGALIIQNQNYGNSFTHNLFQYNGTTAGAIVGNTSSTAYNTSSDYRLKENVNYTWDATTRLKQLKPARFNFIVDETNTLVDGFLAHEVSSIVPEAITGTKDAMTTEVLYVEGDELPEGVSIGDVKEASVPDYQGIDQSKIVPLLVKTIHELEARITALEA